MFHYPSYSLFIVLICVFTGIVVVFDVFLLVVFVLIEIILVCLVKIIGICKSMIVGVIVSFSFNGLFCNFIFWVQDGTFENVVQLAVISKQID